ncbi:MAG: sulfurtransferase-like selenium metabolism protein YedF [Deltaproteobacteria bacterium]|nr:sulfurtransferase-like selenium metabolism protein YedF [Deltaproteobacteria bacterium]
MKELKTVDCRGLTCPQPVIRTKNALQSATTPIRVIVDNEASCTNVRRFAESQGARVQVAEQTGEFHLTIDPRQYEPSAEEPPMVCSTTAARNLVVYVSSEGMGRGDDELGAVLMEAFLDTLSQFKGDLSHAIFVNAGAKLAVEGSPVLEQIRQLEQLGVQVLVCGTCLNHFGIRDKLAVGSVSNMYAIIETLSKAERIIKP